MDSKDKTNENIAIIKEQIDKFDNKANILNNYSWHCFCY